MWFGTQLIVLRVCPVLDRKQFTCNLHKNFLLLAFGTQENRFLSLEKVV